MSLADCRNIESASASQLNASCHCKTLDQNAFHTALINYRLDKNFLAANASFFSNTSFFISPDDYAAIREHVAAVERCIQLPDYQQFILAQYNQNPVNQHTAGVFTGYDFHLSAAGPKLIEINTNAGGGFLNSLVTKAHMACCGKPPADTNFDSQIISMFQTEWKAAGNTQPLSSIAIIDEKPKEQFLYPEFVLAQQLFQQHGIKAIIAAPEDLQLINNKLVYGDMVIDLVYNRLTDFLLTDPKNHLLHKAYTQRYSIITPNPHHYALYADKRNLALLGDSELLTKWGASSRDIQTLLNTIPPTSVVTPINADGYWNKRKQLFFKPIRGFGSRGTYRGDKLTKRVWQEIINSDYVAQECVYPSERSILVAGKVQSLKVDIRAYTYEGKIQQLAARLYQGQTTNFRTLGGGFSPVLVSNDSSSLQWAT